MRSKMLGFAVLAVATALLTPCEADAYGAAHVGYTHVGPSGAYHAGASNAYHLGASNAYHPGASNAYHPGASNSYHYYGAHSASGGYHYHAAYAGGYHRGYVR